MSSHLRILWLWYCQNHIGVMDKDVSILSVLTHAVESIVAISHFSVYAIKNEVMGAPAYSQTVRGCQH